MNIERHWIRYVIVALVVVASGIAISYIVKQPSEQASGPERYGQGGRSVGRSSDSTLNKAVPEALGANKLLSTVTGDQAMAATSRLHQGNVKPALDALIAVYERDGMLWLTRYESAAVAGDQLERMREAMGRYGGGFEQLSNVKVGSSEVFVTKPKGEAQYFWRQGETLAYIAPKNMSQAEAERVIMEIDGELRGLPPITSGE